LLMIVYV